MTTYSWTNETEGRKAVFEENGPLILRKITGEVRKSERNVWPPIYGNLQELNRVATLWLRRGRINLDPNKGE